MLKAWLLQQEQEGDAAVRHQVSDNRRRLEADRKQWVSDVVSSISKLADLDADFLRDPLAWNYRDPASSESNPRKGVTEAQDPQSDRLVLRDGKQEPTGTGYQEASSWAGIHGRRCDRDETLPLEQKEHGGGAEESSSATPPPRGTAEGNDSYTQYHPRPASGIAIAAEIEELAAEKRCARLEALASLARQGLAAHWRAFFRDEMERTRMAATELDVNASRWAQRQREAVGALRDSWQSREWKSAATCGVEGGDSDDSGPTSGSTVAANTPPKGPRTASAAIQAGNAKVEGAEEVTTAYLSKQAGGQVTYSEKMEGSRSGIVAPRNAATEAVGGKAAEVEGIEFEAAPLDTVTDTTTIEGVDENDVDQLKGGAAEPNGAGIVDTSAYVVVVSDIEASCSDGLQEQPSGAEAGTAAAGQLVVFVGRSMAFHTSTIRPSHLENFHEENRRRCSSFSAPPQPGELEHR